MMAAHLVSPWIWKLFLYRLYWCPVYTEYFKFVYFCGAVTVSVLAFFTGYIGLLIDDQELMLIEVQRMRSHQVYNKCIEVDSCQLNSIWHLATN